MARSFWGRNPICIASRLPGSGICSGPIVMDHRVAFAKGGIDGLPNLIPMCHRHNSQKRALTLSQYARWLRTGSETARFAPPTQSALLAVDAAQLAWWAFNKTCEKPAAPPILEGHPCWKPTWRLRSFRQSVVGIDLPTARVRAASRAADETGKAIDAARNLRTAVESSGQRGRRLFSEGRFELQNPLAAAAQTAVSC